jgi:hypothetical protein
MPPVEPDLAHDERGKAPTESVKAAGSRCRTPVANAANGRLRISAGSRLLRKYRPTSLQIPRRHGRVGCSANSRSSGTKITASNSSQTLR